MNLKEKKYLLLDLDGVCYGKHNNYSLERVFGQVSKRMTQFISEKLKIDKDKAKELQINYLQKRLGKFVLHMKEWKNISRQIKLY